MNMRAMVLMLVLVIVWASKVGAAELPEDTARTLIADALEIRENGIAIANIVEGSKRTEDGFEYKTVMRVTAIHPVVGEKGLGRRVRCYDFYYSPKYGWFHQEIRNTRTGEQVWIWSETEGKVIVK